jgi:hypothetical protein
VDDDDDVDDDYYERQRTKQRSISRTNKEINYIYKLDLNYLDILFT